MNHRISLPKFINQFEIQNRMDGDHEVINRCIVSFIDSNNDLDFNLLKAQTSQDVELAKGLVHKLKGASSTIADNLLSEMASSVEDDLYQNNWDKMPELIALVQQHLNTLSKIYLMDSKPSEDESPLLSTLEDFLQMLRGGFYISVSKRESLTEILKKSGYADEAKDIEHALGGFKFEHAIAVIQTVQQKIEKQT